MLLARLEAILNRNVADSRRAQALARQLDGRVMSLTVEGTPLVFFFRGDGGRLAITPSHDGPADDRNRPTRPGGRAPRVRRAGRI